MKKKKLPLILFGVITGRKPICLPSTFVWKILKSFSEKWFWIELVLERFHTWVTLIWRFAFVSMLWITYALLFYDWDIFIAHPLNQGNYEKKTETFPLTYFGIIAGGKPICIPSAFAKGINFILQILFKKGLKQC